MAPEPAVPVVPLRRRDRGRLQRGHIELRDVGGDFLRRDPLPTDPRQGHIGDCYLVSALCAFVQTRPQLLRELIRRNEDGSFVARFHRRLPDLGFASETVRFDGTVPFRSARGEPLYARCSVDALGRESWPLIAEKAYAAWKGGYDIIGEGGLVEHVLEELTGQRSRVFHVPHTEPETLWRLMVRATQSRWPATVCTYGRRARPELDEFGFHPWHIHILFGCHAWRGRRIVWLRDPFDSPPVGSRNLPDPRGVFTIAWEDFLRYFAEVIINANEVSELDLPSWPKRNLLAALGSAYCFRGLSTQTRQAMARGFRRVRHPEGVTLRAASSPSDAFCVVQSGSAGIFELPRGRRARLVGRLEAGDHFGEAAANQAHEIRALSPVALYRMSRGAFESWLLREPQIGERLRRRSALRAWMETWNRRSITAMSLDDLLTAGVERRYRPGAVIQRQDAPAETFFLILEGRAELSVSSSGRGRRRVIEVAERGVVFGAGAVLGRRRIVTATAVTPTTVLEVHVATAASVVPDFVALQRQLEVVAKQRKRRRRAVYGPEDSALNRPEDELLR